MSLREIKKNAHLRQNWQLIYQSDQITSKILLQTEIIKPTKNRKNVLKRQGKKRSAKNSCTKEATYPKWTFNQLLKLSHETTKDSQRKPLKLIWVRPSNLQKKWSLHLNLFLKSSLNNRRRLRMLLCRRNNKLRKLKSHKSNRKKIKRMSNSIANL